MAKNPLIPLFAFALLAGCGDSGGPDAKVDASRMEQVTTLRSLFDQSGGDYNKLSADEKANFVKVAGGDTKAQEAWKQMASTQNAAVPGSGGGNIGGSGTDHTGPDAAGK